MARSGKIVVGQCEEYACFATESNACSGGKKTGGWLFESPNFTRSALARLITSLARRHVR